MMPGFHALTRQQRSTVITTSGESPAGAFLGLEDRPVVMALVSTRDQTLTVSVTTLVGFMPASET